MAQGLLVQRAKELGVARRVRIESAGTHVGKPGQRADPRAQALLKNHGINLSRCRARAVERRDFDRFDYILGMSHGHLDWLREQAGGEVHARLGLIMEFASDRAEIEVPDPYLEKAAAFAQVLALLQCGVDGFVADVLKPALRARGIVDGSTGK